MKTLQSLNTKPWYRALKVLYGIFVFICWTIAIISPLALFIKEQDVSIFLKILYVPWSLFWGYVFSKIPQWFFYYVYFGSVRPKDK